MIPGQVAGVDSVRRVINAVLADPAYVVTEPVDPWAPIRRAWYALGAWVESLRNTNPAAYRVLVWSLVIVLGAIVAHAIWIAARTIRAGAARGMDDGVPVPLQVRGAPWYAQEATRLAAAGDLAGAMQADFLRLVLELDARDLARFHPAKTPIEYAHEVRLEGQARLEFSRLVRTLYVHAFARVPAAPADWDAWRAATTTSRYAAAH